MIEKKAMMKLQRRLLRTYGTKKPDTEKAGLSISDYETLCKLDALPSERHIWNTKSGRTLILK